MYDLCKDSAMTFCEAYRAMVAGRKITGVDWNGTAYVYIKDGTMWLEWDNGDLLQWNPTGEQITEDEYKVVNDEK